MRSELNIWPRPPVGPAAAPVPEVLPVPVPDALAAPGVSTAPGALGALVRTG